MANVQKLAKLAGGVVAAGVVARAVLRKRRRWSFWRRVVVITGGSRGLGLVLARQLASEGARLAILARDAEEMRRAQEEFQYRGVPVIGVLCDVRVEQQVEQAIGQIVEHFGHIDLLINNAGVIQVGPLENMTKRDFEDAIASHIWGPLHTMLATIPHMRRRGLGRIVNIASIGGKVAIPHLAPYSTSKFGLVGMSDGMRAELAKDGIQVTTVCAGLMRTGSSVQASIKGQHQKEYAWFAIADATPLLSVSAERAARQIIEAARFGDAQLIISLPARILAICAGMFPNLLADIAGLAHRLLPASAGSRGNESHSGLESYSAWAPSLLTRLSDRAAARNNELPRNGNGRH
jgi:NAD(P)-dependent dehydrogenase (short-subunit alcohol dehydrogenase family)